MSTAQSSPLTHGVTTVFLDRDGVLNEKMPEGRYVISWDDFHLLPGTADAIARLNRAGLRVVVVSNQRGIALGLYTADDVHVIHARFQHLLKSHDAHVDAFYFCPHDKRTCDCRKPKSGMFDQAISQFPDVTASESVMIGDSLSDIEFGRNLGMRTIFIEGDPGCRKPGGEAAGEMADARCSSLADAVNILIVGGLPFKRELSPEQTP
jgi:D-glycero-D-manno-heptose 1,7-bisphosphate phosphatase